MTAAVFPFTYDANPRHYDAASCVGYFRVLTSGADCRTTAVTAATVGHSRAMFVGMLDISPSRDLRLAFSRGTGRCQYTRQHSIRSLAGTHVS